MKIYDDSVLKNQKKAMQKNGVIMKDRGNVETTFSDKDKIEVYRQKQNMTITPFKCNSGSFSKSN